VKISVTSLTIIPRSQPWRTIPMKFKFSLATMIGTAALLAATSLAFAALSGDDAIKARQADMKANVKGMGVMPC
jgi:hypothetical protein